MNILFLIASIILSTFTLPSSVEASSRISTFTGYPPIHIFGNASSSPVGLSPTDIKNAYHLPMNGGTGTIAIIAAYNDPHIEKDLNVFNRAFNLPLCTTANRCFEKHPMGISIANHAGWSLEQSLDTEWAHAIAPQAKILLIQAKSASGVHLLEAVDYARQRKDVVAVSMSWGGREFRGETALDEHFISTTSPAMVFFASSGDSGAGVNWPAVSKYVVGVGGTSLSTTTENGSRVREVAWSGSGGGVSSFETQPPYQQTYNIVRAHTMRSVPDVSYNADPRHGYSVYRSNGTSRGWYVLGGTSAGAPQWAGIQALGMSVSLDSMYKDKKSDTNENFFRDIVSGSNGECTYYCTARAHYDYITGLGSPLTTKF